ncbi:hypothetical protein JD844_004403 [Phrynosoma platyrhinos]|uniref:Uncharacterized protein n=1 Tax=Phrynosoma platyrhinos TaxID=52577 RepID=A0ABQ7TMR7_PHRPL|nr:hypothetical protein JD844_004403 [Phrynosoma platyrhinos]
MHCEWCHFRHPFVRSFKSSRWLTDSLPPGVYVAASCDRRQRRRIPPSKMADNLPSEFDTVVIGTGAMKEDKDAHLQAVSLGCFTSL